VRSNKRFVAAAILLAACVVAGTAWAADTYQIDPAHTSIGFVVKHMVVTKVRGAFNDFAGTIVYDDKDITKSSVEVTINASSIDTKVEKRDNHLRSPDFFDVAKFPQITFKSKRIEKTADGYAAVGDLTMHGVTKEIRIPFSIAGVITDPMGATRLGLSGQTEINRQDYGVSWSKKLDNGGLVAGDDVEIDLDVEAVKAKQ
jgi:polyisoprenoid-binding protein YceI